DQREGLDGSWTRVFPVQGGRFYRFHAVRQIEGVATPHRSAVVRILWQDDKAKAVLRDTPPVTTEFAKGKIARAQPELPLDGATDKEGWREAAATYRAPAGATRAVIHLHLRWAAGGKIVWSEVSLAECEPPAPRKARLAAVHYAPRGKSI